MKIKLIPVFLFLLLFCTSCGKEKWFSHITYEGYVYDKNGNPATDITLRLQSCGGKVSADEWDQCPNNKFTIATTTTDASGHFYFHERESRIDYYFVYVMYNTHAYFVNSTGESINILTTDTTYTKIHLIQ